MIMRLLILLWNVFIIFSAELNKHLILISSIADNIQLIADRELNIFTINFSIDLNKII
jgi:hypothetical protein